MNELVSTHDVTPRSILIALKISLAENQRLQECMDEMRKIDDYHIQDLVKQNRELATEKEQLKTCILSLNRSDSELRKQLMELQKKRIDLVTQASKSEAVLRKEAAEVKAMRDHLLATSGTTQAEVAALKAERDTLNQKLTELRKWVADQKAKSVARKAPVHAPSATSPKVPVQVQVQAPVAVRVRPTSPRQNQQVQIKVAPATAPPVETRSRALITVKARDDRGEERMTKRPMEDDEHMDHDRRTRRRPVRGDY